MANNRSRVKKTSLGTATTKLLKYSYHTIEPIERLKRYKYRFNGHPAVKQTPTILEISPNLLTHYISENWTNKQFPKRFAISSGDWDFKAKQFERNSKFKYISKYHELDAPSDRTEIEMDWNTSEGLNQFERLYKSIQKNGFKTQEELSDGDGISNKIHCFVGRNGKLIVKHGFHRVSIAKVLSLDSVPVYIRMRHKKWQELRDQIYNNGLPKVAEDLRDHPDLQDVIDN